MRRNFVALAMSLVDDGAEFVHGEGGNVVEDAVFADAIGAVAVNLDPVGAVANLFADGLARVVGAIDQLNSVGNGDIGGVSLERIGTGDVERAGCNLHARAGNDAVVDGLLDVGVGVSGASVSRSRIEVKPYSRARRALTVARIERYSGDCLSS